VLALKSFAPYYCFAKFADQESRPVNFRNYLVLLFATVVW